MTLRDRYVEAQIAKSCSESLTDRWLQEKHVFFLRPTVKFQHSSKNLGTDVIKTTCALALNIVRRWLMVTFDEILTENHFFLRHKSPS